MTTLNSNTEYFLKLVSQYLESGGKNHSTPDFAPMANFSEILKIAVHNKCDLFVYHTIWRWGVEYGLDETTLRAFKNRMLFTAISQLRADAELKEVIHELNLAGVKFMLLKGVILSQLYPDPAYRRSFDADIHVSDEFAERAVKVLTDRGYIYIPKESIKYEKTFQLNEILTVEIHTKLFESFYEKNKATIAAAELESPSNRKEIRVFDTLVETLSPNHFLIYVICHHTKHFIASGINLRHLIDICVYVNRYNEQLNWEYIVSILDRFGIKDFALNLLFICQHHLGMVDLSFLYQDIEEDVVSMLMYDIIERNADNEGTTKRASAHDIVHAAYFRNSNRNINIFKANYFPKGSSLSSKYMYARKHPILLPIAWLHRAFSYFWRKMRGNTVVSPAERAKVANERIELLKRVRIL